MNLVSKINFALARTAKNLVGLAAACTVLALVSMLPAPAFAQQTPSPSAANQDDPVRATLLQFGRFASHPKYGEVWIPTVTPPDWHPYPPCNWVNSKVGWYYDDTTPWGAIVHHYGRWAHDGQLGWVWIPGGDFSPGWVVWRTSQQWIGWAPMLPDEDMQTVSADAFNKGDSWIFQDVPTFERGCSGPAQVAPHDHIAPLLIATTFVTEIEVIDGIVIYVLPPFIGGPVIDIVFDFQPWAPAFLAQVVIDWNWMWNNLNAPGAPCPPPNAPGKQAGGGGGNPPPGGGGNPPPGGGIGGGPPGGGGFATCPDGSPVPANGLCPIQVVATCANGLLPLIQCNNSVIICGAGLHAVGTSCVANVVCTPPATPNSSGIGCVLPDPPGKVAGGGCNGPNGAYAGCSGGGNNGPGGPPGGAKCLYGGTPPKCNGPPSDVMGGSGCAPGGTPGDGGYCQADKGTQAFNDQTCDLKITVGKACVASGVTCGAPGLLPCGPGQQHPVQCSDGTYRLNCPYQASNPCGPMKHVLGSKCVADVTCVLPEVKSLDGTQCVDAQADKQGGRPRPSPSPSSATIVVPTICCTPTHPSYGPPIVVATPTPRPTVAATGMPTPTPTATFRPGAVATATPTPMATYRPPPREPLPPAIIEKKPDIGHEPARPVEVISHGGGGTNTYTAKPIVTTNAKPAVAMSNSAPQPYRAPPVVIAHPMPAAAVVRKPGLKP